MGHSGEKFDHTDHQHEVEERWGADASSRSERWWNDLGEAGQEAHRAQEAAIRAELIAQHAERKPADSAVVQEIMTRHYAWVRAGWGGVAPNAAAFRGLADMYTADPRFVDHYGSQDVAEYVRAAMHVYATNQLS